MVGAAPESTSGPARVPASTIRRVRQLHNLDQAGFAACFRVSVRSVIRWEQRGLDPADLPTDSELDGPEWRRGLLDWFLSRDTPEKEASTCESGS